VDSSMLTLSDSHSSMKGVMNLRDK
jgi:hypothetical protein